MDEQTTTDTTVESGGQSINGVSIDDQGMAIPQPEDTGTVAAEEETTEETSQEAPQEEQEPSKDDNSTQEWLKKKGIDPGSPEAIEKVAEMARNAEKAMHSKAQRASELEKAIDEGITQEAQATGYNDEDKIRLVRLELRQNIRDFFDANPDAKQFEQAMVSELATKPHLAGDLESLYANAVIKSGGLDSVRSQAKRETLESLAQKQKSAVPRGNAVSSAIGSNEITPQNVDQLVAKNDQKWFEANYDAINRAMAG